MSSGPIPAGRAPGVKLLLFDIDQTLIHTAGAGMRCLGRAVHEVLGVDIAAFEVHPDGKTDPAILDEIVRAAGVPDVAAVEHEIWRRYEQYLGEELSREDARRGVKPGVPDLLETLRHDPRARLGLLTGNLQVTARVKLAAFGLHEYFEVGAFGSDSPDRNALGRVALQRARVHWGRAFDAGDTWIIGDTERDVEAARACGARVLAVATGGYSVAALQSTGADAVLPDLSDTARVLEILLAG